MVNIEAGLPKRYLDTDHLRRIRRGVRGPMEDKWN